MAMRYIDLLCGKVSSRRGHYERAGLPKWSTARAADTRHHHAVASEDELWLLTTHLGLTRLLNDKHWLPITKAL